MKNKMRIVSNSESDNILYQIKSEDNKWIPVSHFSKLSRKEFTNTSIINKGEEILFEIDKTYNQGIRGVEIFFEGSEEEYNILNSIIKEKYEKKGIICNFKRTEVIVAGKVGTGKTTLINAISSYENMSMKVTKMKNYDIFENDKKSVSFYEISGINVGEGSIEQFESTTDMLTKNNVSTMIYCISNGKIEDVEVKIIKDIKQRNPEISIAVAMSRSHGDPEEELAAERISNILGNIPVYILLAEEEKIRSGMVIDTFGVDKISHFIFGGK